MQLEGWRGPESSLQATDAFRLCISVSGAAIKGCKDVSVSRAINEFESRK